MENNTGVISSFKGFFCKRNLKMDQAFVILIFAFLPNLPKHYFFQKNICID